MNIDEKLYSVLFAYTALTDMVEQRMYPIEIPDETLEPCVRYRQISGLPAGNTSGSTMDADCRYQFDCYSSKLHEAKLIQNQVHAALNSSNQFQVEIINTLPSKKDRGLHIATTDYRIFNV